jgi:eukaryotic-like serine/threonine-protein kinase
VRGQANLRLGRAAEAQSEFRKILDRPSLDILFPLAHLGMARAYALGGNAGASRSSYEDFFALWKDADPDLPVLIEAKKDYAMLPRS